MKKRLICFLILSSFIIGLVFVGSCKDYDDFALDIRVQNIDNRLADNSKSFADSLDSIRQRLGRIKQCACVPSTIKDSIAVLYNYLGDVINTDTCSIDTAPGKPLKGVGKIVNYLNRQLTLMAAEVEVDDLRKRIDKLWRDSIDPALDTAKMAYEEAKWVADSLRNHRFGIGDSIKNAMDTAAMAYVWAKENKSDIATLKTRTNNLADSLKNAYDSISDLKDSVKNHLARIEGLEQEDVKLNRLVDSLAGVTARDSVRIQDLITSDANQNKLIDSLAQVTKRDSIRTKEYFDKALAYADSIGDTIRAELYDSIDKVVKAYQAADAQIWTEISKIYDSITHAYDSIAVHRTAINALSDSIAAHRQLFDDIFDSIADHRKLFNDIFDSIAELSARMDSLENVVDSLKDAREKNISNIRINGTRNDVFGSFALPVNLRSNILMTYYSDFPGVKKFPSTSLPALDGSSEWTAEDDALISSLGEQLLSGRVVGESADNAGKLYFTLNPNDVKIDDTYEFYLMTSDNVKTPVALSNIHKSTEKLTFGYSSNLFVNGQVIESDINTDNGFYEADAKIEASDAYSLRPHLDVDKSQLKAVVSDVKNYKDGIDLKGMATTLINTVLKSTDGILDANALYVSWEDAYGKHSAVSDYNLAAFAVKPLSYNTFTSLSIPEIEIPKNPIQYLINRAANKAKSETDKITLHFKKINIKNVSFVLPDVTFKPFDSETDKPIKIYIEASGNGKTVKDTVVVPFDDAYMKVRQPILDALKDIEDVIGILNFNMDSVINEMRKDINTQANDVINSIQGTVKSSIKKAIGELATEVGNNKYVKKLESLASQMSTYYNKYSDGFGRLFVQPVLLYLDDNGDMHPMSRSVTVPTLYTTKNIDLIITSLTNEIVTPAYKKFVAVTNYVDPSTLKDYQNDKDATAKSVIDGINNNGGEIGVVLDGSTKAVTFNAPQPGIYELLLSTIDYDGYVFNRKFYVNVQY
jgi:predicted  nucleic acid-binding Zn-ribbon protein